MCRGVSAAMCPLPPSSAILLVGPWRPRDSQERVGLWVAQSSATSQLCDCGQVTCRLWASLSSHGQNVSGKVNSECKDSEVGVSLVQLRATRGAGGWDSESKWEKVKADR